MQLVFSQQPCVKSPFIEFLEILTDGLFVGISHRRLVNYVASTRVVGISHGRLVKYVASTQVVWVGVGVVPVLQASACNTGTTPTQPHRNFNTHQTKNNTTNVVIQQNSRKLLMMDILMSETC